MGIRLTNLVGPATQSNPRVHLDLIAMSRGGSEYHPNDTYNDEYDFQDSDAVAQRLIIAADIDCFYAQSEILLDPNLSPDTPLGVQQKQIIVTCNYPARARGVKKLQLLKDSLAACPDLVIKDGSDIQPYRRCSNRVWEVLGRAVGVWDKIWAEAGVSAGLVANLGSKETTKSLDWKDSEPPLDPQLVASLPTKLERLGLDEFFFDVTALVDNHLEGLNEQEAAQGHRWFSMPLFRDPRDPSLVFTGFSYLSDFLPPNDTQIVEDINPKRVSPRLALAAHVSLYLRTLLRRCTGFTTSAGISSSKVLAKLASDVKKPDGQSVLPEEAREVFVGAVEIGRLQGVGHRMKRDLEDWLGGKALGEDGQVVARPNEWPGHEDPTKARPRVVGIQVDINELDAEYPDDEVEADMGKGDGRHWRSLDDDDPREETAPQHPTTWLQAMAAETARNRSRGKLTPSVLLPLLTVANPPPTLSALLSKHPTLVPLLCGIDNNPVKMTLLPTQISIEDSFRCAGAADLQQRTANTIEWLIERMEEEEMVDLPGSEPIVDGKPKRKWRRYPRNLRLSIRRRSLEYGVIQSKTLATPFALVDTLTALPTRISRVHKALESALRTLLLAHNVGGSSETERLELASRDVVVLNLAVLGFQKEWVEGSGDIGRFLVKKEIGVGENLAATGGDSFDGKENESATILEPSRKSLFGNKSADNKEPPKATPAQLAKLGIDAAVFDELPPELQAEILKSGVAQDKPSASTGAGGSGLAVPAKRKGGPLDRFLK